MSSQYKIQYSSMDQLMVNISTKTDEWYAQLDAWKTSYTAIVNMTSFTGQSADAVKAYLGEVHEFLLQSIYVAISRFQSEYLLYKNGYYNIEDNIYASIPQETIKAIESRMSTEFTYLGNISGDIDTSLSSVSDIFYTGKPSKSTLENYLCAEKDSMATLNTTIEDYERTGCSAAGGELRELLEALKSTVAAYRNSGNSVLSYKSGDICGQTEVLDLYPRVRSSTEYIQSRQGEIELAAAYQQEVFTQMQEDYEAACKAREDEGLVKIVSGIGAAILGGVAIFCTAGAATPIVVTAWVSGSCSMAYGISNMIEGGQDVYYGAVGDLDSEAINPIRDTVFMGNQGAYDLWGSLNMAVAGMCVPVTKSLSGVEGASKSILAKTAAKTVAREVVIDESVGFVSSNVANFAANQLDLNQTETLLLNMGLSVGLEKGVDTASARLSGKTTFADGMDVDDAKRYNDYCADVEAGTHTGHPGLTDEDIRAWDFADSKVNEHLAVSEVDTNAVVKLRADIAASENRFINGGGLGSKSGKYSSLGEMSDADGIKYSNWMKVREGELYTDYLQAGKELTVKLDVDGYKILKAEDATIANADWYDMGFDKPPIAENTIAYTVEAGNHSYARVYLEGYNNPISIFVVRADEIVGLNAQEIAEKLALPKVPNKIVEVQLPPSTPLEVSIVGPQPDWGTIGGDVQFAIKDVDLNPQWFTNIRDLE